MDLEIIENVSRFYHVNKDIIPEYKEWVIKHNTEISKQSFWEFLIYNYCVDDFEDDNNINDVDMKNFEEF